MTWRPFHFLVVAISGWMNREQPQVIPTTSGVMEGGHLMPNAPLPRCRDTADTCGQNWGFWGSGGSPARTLRSAWSRPGRPGDGGRGGFAVRIR